MEDETKRPDEDREPRSEGEDVEGHSFLYEQARTFARDREREAQKQARESRWFKERKEKKR